MTSVAVQNTCNASVEPLRILLHHGNQWRKVFWTEASAQRALHQTARFSGGYVRVSLLHTLYKRESV
ncbi:hypothetical protein [Chlorogloea sp. CCALA 695]|uniref:hypothetical protein n=1 Tax=Chlorogloea sp. CCALA 695 TaxID=2107693 RepID=UPI0018EA8506|nr:hypothetical protein [Chlorogloea sp. CCALA 695]